MIIIGDIHGSFNTFMTLLDRIPEEEKAKGIVISGDLIDRGPRSREVVQYCIDNNIMVTMGNHEDMMIDCRGVLRWVHPWMNNGGPATLSSYGTNMYVNELGAYEEIKTFEQQKDIANHVEIRDVLTIQDHMEWMKKLPIYLAFPDIKNSEGRYLVVSHSHIANVWKRIQTTGMTDDIKTAILWDRPHKLKNIPEIYNVIGHTPTPNEPKIKQIYANIDTGCHYKGRLGLGVLTALQFPEMIIYQQENIDG